MFHLDYTHTPKMAERSIGQVRKELVDEFDDVEIFRLKNNTDSAE